MDTKNHTYCPQEQNQIYNAGASAIVNFVMKETSIGFTGHGKLNALEKDNDWRTAFSYACGALNDTVNLHSVFCRISEEADQCNETYTPEVYLSDVIPGVSYATKKSRQVFKEVTNYADTCYELLSGYAERCQTDVIELLRILSENERDDLLEQTFHGQITMDQLNNWLRRTEMESFVTDDLISGLIELQNDSFETSTPIEDSKEKVIKLITQLAKSMTARTVSVCLVARN